MNHAKPLKTEKTKLGTKYQLNPRHTKPGREILVAFDQEFPLADFNVDFSYYVRFLEADNTAGNHYHEHKQEILIPITGEFEVVLEDIKTKEKEVFQFNALDNQALYIRAGVAHKVTSKEKNGVLLVLAPGSSMDIDHFDYQIN